MTDHRLPEHLAARKFVMSNSEIAGTWPVAQFARLQALLATNAGDVSCRFRGEVDATGRHLLHVSVQGELSVVCQTCMGPMPVPVNSEFTLHMVKHEDQIDDESEIDPILVEEDEFAPRDIVEDELILSLPVVANHEPGQCGVAMSVLQPPETDVEVEILANPFAALASMKPDVKSPKGK